MDAQVPYLEKYYKDIHFVFLCFLLQICSHYFWNGHFIVKQELNSLLNTSNSKKEISLYIYVLNAVETYYKDCYFEDSSFQKWARGTYE